MLSCGRCGQDNPDGELLCSRCGTELDDGGAKALIGEVVLGVYKITDILGRGGMSVVYKASHKLTEQRVALKILPPELAIHAALKTRFLEEAKALARLEHANIVRLYNFGEEAGRFVLAMEYVEGQTFERMILKQGKVAWPASARIAVEVCKALEYAHEKGIVHRDIKPSNVLVRADGSATVMDFGIAKMTESTRLTATGQTMGTVRYMSPEQVRGQSVDHRTDLYSLGIALFEGIAGDTPFQGETHFDIMSKHLSDAPPSLRAITADTPEALERVIHFSLGKGRDERYQSASEMRAAIEKCLEGLPADQVAPARVFTPLPAPLPTAPARAKDKDKEATPAPAAATVQSPSQRANLTGLASSLEPAYSPEASIAPRRRTGLWLGLAAAVAAAAAVVIVMSTRKGSSAQQPVAKQADARLAELKPEWPEPRQLSSTAYVVDQKFEAESVRVLATDKRDAKRLARVYQGAQKKFVAFAKKQTGADIEVHPLNLAVVPAESLCDPAIYEPDPVTSGCNNIAFYYEPHTRTLFVAPGNTLEVLDIPEGAAVHLCRNSNAFKDKACGPTLLDPFAQKLESDLGLK